MFKMHLFFKMSQVLFDINMTLPCHWVFSATLNSKMAEENGGTAFVSSHHARSDGHFR